MNTTIYMVRHAESPFVFGKEKERGLSEEGFIAAEKVARCLENVPIHYIASSSYTRAIQTVQPLANLKKLDIITYDELRERPIKGLDYKSPWKVIEEAIEKSFVDLDFALEGGESTYEAHKRAIPIVEKMIEDNYGKNIVIGTHGNIMTIIMKYFDQQYGYNFWKSTSKPDIYKLVFKEKKLMEVERVWEE